LADDDVADVVVLHFAEDGLDGIFRVGPYKLGPHYFSGWCG